MAINESLSQCSYVAPSEKTSRMQLTRLILNQGPDATPRGGFAMWEIPADGNCLGNETLQRWLGISPEQPLPTTMYVAPGDQESSPVNLNGLIYRVNQRDGRVYILAASANGCLSRIELHAQIP